MSSLLSKDTKTEFKAPEIKQISVVPVPVYSDIAKAANDVRNLDNPRLEAFLQLVYSF